MSKFRSWTLSSFFFNSLPKLVRIENYPVRQTLHYGRYQDLFIAESAIVMRWCTLFDIFIGVCLCVWHRPLLSKHVDGQSTRTFYGVANIIVHSFFKLIIEVGQLTSIFFFFFYLKLILKLVRWLKASRKRTKCKLLNLKKMFHYIQAYDCTIIELNETMYSVDVHIA